MSVNFVILIININKFLLYFNTAHIYRCILYTACWLCRVLPKPFAYTLECYTTSNPMPPP